MLLYCIVVRPGVATRPLVQPACRPGWYLALASLLYYCSYGDNHTCGAHRARAPTLRTSSSSPRREATCTTGLEWAMTAYHLKSLMKM